MQSYSQKNIENALYETIKMWVRDSDIETISDTFWDRLNLLTVKPIPTNRDEKIQAVVDLKERKTDLLREEAEWAVVFTADNDAGGMASPLVTSSSRVKLWARVYEAVGPQGIDNLAPLDHNWWKAILNCPNPAEALQEALDLELTTAQIKERWGLVKHREPPVYSGSLVADKFGDNKLEGWLDLNEETTNAGPGTYHITVKKLSE